MTASLPDMSELHAACSATLLTAGFSQEFCLEPLDGGANNRVFRVVLDGHQLLLKHYFLHSDDTRDRLSAEFSFAQFAWRNGIRTVPQPIAASQPDGLALYEFIDGRRITSDQITGDHVQAAIHFYRQLNQRKRQAEAQNLPIASEAYFRLSEHLSCV